MPSAPAVLWFVRHGQSAANIARDTAYARDAEDVDVDVRDPDVPLTPLGEQQSTALGRWWGEQPADARPTVVLSSPYTRARQTAERIVAAGALAPGAAANGAPANGAPGGRIVFDERWREKELGLFFRVTHRGIRRRYPEQWALRQELGVFYYRPPNGESGADVVTRVRAALADVAREYAGERVLVVCHQVTILAARYALERMTEETLMAAWTAYDLANCSVTEYRPDPALGGRLALVRWNATLPVAAEGAPVTDEPPAGVVAGDDDEGGGP